MTTPDTTDASFQGNTDAPTASVGIGPSEITGALVIISGLLDTYFGQDWGVGKNAQAFGVLVAGLVTLGLTISRAIKHHGAMHANASVYIAQLHAVTVAAQTDSGLTPTGIAAGISTLNTAVQADTEGDAAP